MTNLFNIAIDPDIPLEDRYAAIRVMQLMHEQDPRDYRTMAKQREWRRKYRKLQKEA